MTAHSLWLALILTPSLCVANELAAPPITNESINGTWEAVVAEEDIVRMEIRGRGESYLVDADRSDRLSVFRLVQREIKDDGQVLLRFTKISGDYPAKEVTLQGYGYISGPGDENPELRVKLLSSLGSIDVHFMKGITQRLAKLSRRAGEAIAHQKR